MHLLPLSGSSQSLASKTHHVIFQTPNLLDFHICNHLFGALWIVNDKHYFWNVTSPISAPAEAKKCAKEPAQLALAPNLIIFQIEYIKLKLSLIHPTPSLIVSWFVPVFVTEKV